jgi:hypothetical protein
MMEITMQNLVGHSLDGHTFRKMSQSMKAMGFAAVFAVFGWVAIIVSATSAQAADRTRVEEFLNVTGFDVALDSIRLSAETAPNLLGLDADDFGFQWTILANEVFASDVMHTLAVDILSETLTDELLDHAADFYATDLGTRLVEVENASHMADDDELKSESGEAIVDGLIRIGSPRVEILKRMNAASDSTGTSIRAIQEVQVRFLMAAAGAGVIDLQLDEPDLRELLSTNEPEMRISMQASALTGSAYTYQAFSDDEVEAYTQALEHPDMKMVYNLMNAVQFEVMADRYEALAARMSNLQPSEDL